MRLIDADAFHDFIHKHCDDPIEGLWHELVRGQPTAYDVDKVVERLEEEAKYNQSEANELAQRGDYGTATRLEGIAKGYKYSLDIVKSGGIEQR